MNVGETYIHMSAIALGQSPLKAHKFKIVIFSQKSVTLMDEFGHLRSLTHDTLASRYVSIQENKERL